MKYIPSGVCSREMEVELNGNKIDFVKVKGGCSGNLQGIMSLLRGMDVDEAIGRLSGIKCGFKSTSCPDQLSKALQLAKGEEANTKNAE